MVQGATDVVLSLVDVLGYLDKIPVCTAYEIDGKIVYNYRYLFNGNYSIKSLQNGKEKCLYFSLFLHII